MILVSAEDTYMTVSFVHGPLDGDLLLRLLPGCRGWVVEGGRGYPQILHPEQDSPTAPGTAEVLRYHDPAGLTHFYMWSYDRKAYLYLHEDDSLVPFGTPAGRFPPAKAAEPLPPPPHAAVTYLGGFRP